MWFVWSVEDNVVSSGTLCALRGLRRGGGTEVHQLQQAVSQRNEKTVDVEAVC